MINSPITIVGRVCSDPLYIGKKDNSDGVLKLRIASSRSYRQGEKWHNTDQLYINVEAWGRLGINAHQSLTTGVSVIIQGMLYTNEWAVTEGDSDKLNKRQEVRMRALSIGIDLNTYRVGFVDARPRLENVPDGVTIPEDTSSHYPNPEARQFNNSEDNGTEEGAAVGEESQLVSVGASEHTEE